MALKYAAFGLWITLAAVAAAPAALTLTGDWQVKVEEADITAAVTIDRPDQVIETDETDNWAIVRGVTVLPH